MITTLTKSHAKALGYKALTTAYELNEKHMLDNVIADMQRGGIPFALVSEDPRGVSVEVWRK